MPASTALSTLDALESEAIHILREVVALCRSPVLLYSIGKDSSVLLHLVQKAFAPGPIPVPLLHVDTGWKFREMIDFRDRRVAETGARLIIHHNAAGARDGITPFSVDSGRYTRVMKTEALKQALTDGGFDAAIGGARRDEEASRAKERIVSFRNAHHAWDPRTQRPEFWRLFNTRVGPGESVRVFPLSNWTELDIWRYIEREAIPIVPLYFARDHDTVERDGSLIVRDDDRLPLRPGEVPVRRSVRFRSLGCYPLTAAVPSDARTLAAVAAEVQGATESERGGRLIDRDAASSMERKKQEGYF